MAKNNGNDYFFVYPVIQLDFFNTISFDSEYEQLIKVELILIKKQSVKRTIIIIHEIKEAKKILKNCI